MKRWDIFTHTPQAGDHGSDWRLYVAACTPTNARRIADNLAIQGEHVRCFTHAKTLGRMMYEIKP